MSRCCGVILAGGSGERFGGPKAYATLPDGRTFLVACRDLLAAAGCAPVVASLPCGSSPAAIAGVRALALPRPGLAMFESLRAALTVALAVGDWDRAIVLPVDHPLVRPATVRDLAAAPADAVVPVYRGKRGHPIALRRDLAAGVASGERPGPTLREVVHEAGAVDLQVDDPGVGWNCNTPAALAAAWAQRA